MKKIVKKLKKKKKYIVKKIVKKLKNIKKNIVNKILKKIKNIKKYIIKKIVKKSIVNFVKNKCVEKVLQDIKNYFTLIEYSEIKTDIDVPRLSLMISNFLKSVLKSIESITIFR